MIEDSCCVVTVSAEHRSFSCSGVILSHRSGLVICNAFPFSRFVKHKIQTPPVAAAPPPPAAAPPPPPLSSSRFWSPDSRFTADLDIRVYHSPARRDVNTHKTTSHVPPSPPPPRTAKVLMLLNCLEFNKALHTLFQESDQWKFHNDDDDDGVEKLIQEARFLSCTGIVSNLSGEGNAVILTDARCLPGTEGGGLFVTEGHDHLSSSSSSSAHLVGVIVASLCWKGVEWIGLTLVCFCPGRFLRNLRDVAERMEVDSLTESRAEPSPSPRSSGARGSWVAPHLVLTCRHVVNGKKTVTLRFHHEEEGDRIHVCVGDVLFSTQPSSSYDFAVVRLRDSAPEVVEVPVVAESFQPGGGQRSTDAAVLPTTQMCVFFSVLYYMYRLVLRLSVKARRWWWWGYGALGKRCGPSLTGGILSKAVSWDRRPVMLQTTCAVQGRRQRGRCGIVSSNTRDCAANVTYPHLNFSIPGSVFQPLLQRFSQSGDVEVFRGLDAVDPGVQRVWRLQNPPSKL
ncbi:hypothetical protein CRUP_002414 [Coryphaenoides rupestris]|nr:hypothetical protein CRUP_002414 [Coryphaenoides rupestris]